MERSLKWAGAIFVVLVVAFNVGPLVVLVGSSFSDSVILDFPPETLSLRWYEDAMRNDQWLTALGYSAAIATVVAAVSTAVCFLAALVTVRTTFPGKFALEMVAVSPLVLPHAATALVLFRLAGAFGLVGHPGGLVLAHTIMALPFGYLMCVAGLKKVDPSLEEAAMSLGLPPAEVFRRVTLPLAKTAAVGAFLFAFLLSFDEATVALFLRGVDVITLPVAIFNEINDNATPLISAISVLLILLTIAIMWVAKRLVGLQIFYNQREL